MKPASVTAHPVLRVRLRRHCLLYIILCTRVVVPALCNIVLSESVQGTSPIFGPLLRASLWRLPICAFSGRWRTLWHNANVKLRTSVTAHIGDDCFADACFDLCVSLSKFLYSCGCCIPLVSSNWTWSTCDVSNAVPSPWLEATASAVRLFESSGLSPRRLQTFLSLTLRRCASSLTHISGDTARQPHVHSRMERFYCGERNIDIPAWVGKLDGES